MIYVERMSISWWSQIAFQHLKIIFNSFLTSRTLIWSTLMSNLSHIRNDLLILNLAPQGPGKLYLQICFNKIVPGAMVPMFIGIDPYICDNTRILHNWDLTGQAWREEIRFILLLYFQNQQIVHRLRLRVYLHWLERIGRKSWASRWKSYETLKALSEATAKKYVLCSVLW